MANKQTTSHYGLTASGLVGQDVAGFHVVLAGRGFGYMSQSESQMPTAGPEQIRARVVERVRHMARVPLISGGGQLLDIAHQSVDEVNVSELDHLINQDPVMASRLLRTANSPYYGAVHGISTVRHAIITVGLNDVMNLVLATSVAGSFEQKSRMRRLDSRDFWLHSVAVGAAARAAAPVAGVAMLSPAEIGLAGLLHDIGKNLFMAQFPELYDDCLGVVRDTQRSLVEVEREVFGIGHDEVGGMLAAEWNLPAFLTQAVRWHHAPEESDEVYVDAVRLVRWADRFARTQEFGQGGNREPQAEDDNLTAVALERRLTEPRPKIIDHVRRQLESMGGIADPMEPAASAALSADDDSPRRRPAAAPKRSLWDRIRDLFS